jgi:hypothetical protein
MTHVAFANDASFGGVFWNVVWTLQNAVLATDALIGQVPDDPGRLILFISQHRATFETGRLEAMMTGGRDSLLIRLGGRPAMQQPDAAPGLIFVQSIERVAGAHAGFAAGATIQIDSKGILLTGARALQRHQILVVFRAPFRVLIMPLRESIDRRQLLLFSQQFV